MSAPKSGKPEFMLLEGILRCDPGMVRSALDKGASASIVDRDNPQIWRLISLDIEGAFPLYEAAVFTSRKRGGSNGGEIASLLLNAGAPINMVNDKGYTALHKAAVMNNPATVKALIEHGADVNIQSQRGYTPLHTAAFGRSPEAAFLLLQAGARMDVANEKGLDVISYAEKLGRSEMLALLHSHMSSEMISKVSKMNYNLNTFEARRARQRC